jgi:hypothetical protein
LETRVATRITVLALLLGAACSETSPATPPPIDRFYYPTGVAVRHVPAGCAPRTPGCQTQLVVASSNFDLRYDPARGGTVIVVDVDAAVARANPSVPPPPLAQAEVLGAARIGNFSGNVALLDAQTCPGWVSDSEVLVASRSRVSLFRLPVSDAGVLSCEGPCEVPLDPSFADPFNVTVACGDFGRFAYVNYLRTPDTRGWVEQLGLDDDARTSIDFGQDPVDSTFFDAPTTRLYATARFNTLNYTPLRINPLAIGGNPPAALSTTNFFAAIRGSELRGFAVSTDRTKAYVAVKLYDADAAAALGVRSTADIGGALAVLDLTEQPGGGPTLRVLRLVPIDRGPNEVRVLSRKDPVTGASRPDLVAVTATDDSTLSLYDDETGRLAQVFSTCSVNALAEGKPAPCDPGFPSLGKQPFGLEVEPIDGTHARIYIGSFDRSWVNVIEIDPQQPAAAPVSWVRIGAERK